MLALLASACPAAAALDSPGWTVTVYYTAVESLHHEPPTPVRGCPNLSCDNGNDDLGSYPADFVQAVVDEGAGRTTAGQYLNWSDDTGFWLDTAPRDANGRPLAPFRSAAADGLADGTWVTLVDCGLQDDGTEVPAEVCQQLRAPTWQIRDAFTPGLGGDKHIDLYLGEETGPDFIDSPLYTTLVGAVVRVPAPGPS
ncbi:hypothetical protein F0L68_23755 [Solihabitans fulvus]|uniref:Uncharacterized protein n=1 Tax=Solihabitans fulvus TaxID=1892852 RepID=A0A5B2X6Q7_9PSEU|nr:hypothetical protein F0L68_23755 [Solihabitans fulvus]